MPCNFYVSHKALARDTYSVVLGPVRVQEGKALRVFVLAVGVVPAVQVTVDCYIGTTEPDFTVELSGGAQANAIDLAFRAVPQTVTSTHGVAVQEVVFPELDRPACWVMLEASAPDPMSVLGIFLLASGR